MIIWFETFFFFFSFYQIYFHAKKYPSPLYIIPNPRSKFTAQEFDLLTQFIQNGGSVLISASDAGESSSNINFFLEEYQMSLNNDGVVRTSYHKFTHPKECLITVNDKCIINRPFLEACGPSGRSHSNLGASGDLLSQEFVYPYGCSINMMNPAIPLIISGPVSFPVNRPIIAAFQNTNGGKLLCSGSTHIFHDAYINNNNETDNFSVIDPLFSWLLNLENSPRFENSNIEVDFQEYLQTPSTETMFSRPKGILQGGDSNNLTHESAKDLRTGSMYDVVICAKYLLKQLHLEKFRKIVIDPLFPTGKNSHQRLPLIRRQPPLQNRHQPPPPRHQIPHPPRRQKRTPLINPPKLRNPITTPPTGRLPGHFQRT